MFVVFLFIFFIGLCFGSFSNVLICRLPQGKSILGRSVCPRCKNKISFWDNIPLLSFLFLKGKCRECQGKISFQYPLVEFTTALLFVISFYLLPFPFFIYFALLTPILVAIFVIDVKYRIIPDELIFAGFAISVLFFLLSAAEGQLYARLLAGFTTAIILLFLHLVTRGRGMGLGDVKLAVLGGTVVGLTQLLNWLFVAFLTGAAVGSILILTQKAKLKSKIAFGPFLIFALFLVVLFNL